MSAETLQIMLIDDNKDHVELIRRAFISNGKRFNLIVTDTLAKARKVLEKTMPDLMVVDFHLPDGTGIELLPGDPQKRVIPIIVLTGHGDEQIAAAAIKAGAMDYLVKSDETFAAMPQIAERVLREWQDITKRKQAEEALLLERELSQTYLNIAGVMIIALNSRGEISMINRRGCEILGYSHDDIINKNWFETCIRQDYRDEIQGVFNQLMNGELEPVEYYENPVINKQGEDIIISFHNTLLTGVDGEVTGILFSGEDITKQKKAEVELRQSEANLKEAHEIAQMGRWELNLISNTLHWSDTIYEIFGIDREQFGASYEAFLDAIHPDDRDEVNKRYTDSLIDKKPYAIEHRLLMADGSIKWVDENCRTDYDAEGKALRSVGVVHDITKRKQAEVRVLENEKKFHSIADSLPVAIYASSDVDQTCEYLNPCFTELFGYILDEVPSVNAWWPLAYPDEDYRQKVSDQWQLRVERAIETGVKIEPMETVVTCKDGSKKTVAWGFITTGKTNFAIGLNLTEQRGNEDQIKEKLDEVERMNRLMVGRELKMEELRKEISSLKDEVSRLRLL